jgi:hypothetical protein
MKTPKDQKPPSADAPSSAPGQTPTRLPSHISLEMERAEERKRRLGSSGPASEVRRIDPKDYQPAPTNKPTRPPRPRKG